MEMNDDEKQYSLVAKPPVLGQAAWIWIQVSPGTGWETLGKYHNLSFLMCKTGINNALQVIHKVLEKLLANSKCLIYITYFYYWESFSIILMFKETLWLFFKVKEIFFKTF